MVISGQDALNYLRDNPNADLVPANSMGLSAQIQPQQAQQQRGLLGNIVKGITDPFRKFAGQVPEISAFLTSKALEGGFAPELGGQDSLDWNQFAQAGGYQRMAQEAGMQPVATGLGKALTDEERTRFHENPLEEVGKSGAGIASWFVAPPAKGLGLAANAGRIGLAGGLQGVSQVEDATDVGQLAKGIGGGILGEGIGYGVARGLGGLANKLGKETAEQAGKASIYDEFVEATQKRAAELGDDVAAIKLGSTADELGVQNTAINVLSGNEGVADQLRKTGLEITDETKEKLANEMFSRDDISPDIKRMMKDFLGLEPTTEGVKKLTSQEMMEQPLKAKIPQALERKGQAQIDDAIVDAFGGYKPKLKHKGSDLFDLAREHGFGDTLDRSIGLKGFAEDSPEILLRQAQEALDKEGGKLSSVLDDLTNTGQKIEVGDIYDSFVKKYGTSMAPQNKEVYGGAIATVKNTLLNEVKKQGLETELMERLQQEMGGDLTGVVNRSGDIIPGKIDDEIFKRAVKDIAGTKIDPQIAIALKRELGPYTTAAQMASRTQEEQAKVINNLFGDIHDRINSALQKEGFDDFVGINDRLHTAYLLRDWIKGNQIKNVGEDVIQFGNIASGGLGYAAGGPAGAAGMLGLNMARKSPIVEGLLGKGLRGAGRVLQKAPNINNLGLNKMVTGLGQYTPQMTPGLMKGMTQTGGALGATTATGQGLQSGSQSSQMPAQQGGMGLGGMSAMGGAPGMSGIPGGGLTGGGGIPQQAGGQDLLMQGLMLSGGDMSQALQIASFLQSSAPQQSTAPDLGATAMNQVRGIQSTLQQLRDAEQAIQGGKTGFVAGLQTKLPFGLGRDKKVLGAQLDILAQNLAKSLEKGTLTDADIKRYKAMLPSISDNPSVAQGKLENVRRLLQTQLQQYTY